MIPQVYLFAKFVRSTFVLNANLLKEYNHAYNRKQDFLARRELCSPANKDAKIVLAFNVMSVKNRQFKQKINSASYAIVFMDSLLIKL
jgi:hypothetical protein